MPVTYPDPNGGSMTVANEAEARARGWTPSMGTLGAYSQDANFKPAKGGGGSASQPAPVANPGTVGGGTSMNLPGLGQVSGMSGAAIDAYLQALMSGNKAAADEAIRQFNVAHQLDQTKFDEGVRQYNQTFGQAQELQAANISAQQAGLTGTYQGAPTMAAKALGLQAIQTAATLQPNAFRQQEALYGLSQNGTSPLMQAAAGMAPLPAFQAPSLSAADTRSMGWLAQQGGPGSYTADQSQQWLNGLPAPHQINWNALGRATPGAQNLVVQGLAQKWGLPESDILAIGHATLPAFTAPTTSGRVG